MQRLKYTWWSVDQHSSQESFEYYLKLSGLYTNITCPMFVGLHKLCGLPDNYTSGGVKTCKCFPQMTVEWGNKVTLLEKP